MAIVLQCFICYLANGHVANVATNRYEVLMVVSNISKCKMFVGRWEEMHLNAIKTWLIDYPKYLIIGRSLSFHRN